nr:hypothetical protein CFP56_31031 [Quercus suber]
MSHLHSAVATTESKSPQLTSNTMGLPPSPPATPQGPGTLRRSCRLNPLDSNGRSFLADQLGLSVRCFESWLASPAVLPHLSLWRILCITSRARYNTAIEWINSGPQGYFYNPSHLEEDLLLLCLGEGSGAATDGRFADPTPPRLTSWTTQAVWARCAWRIVEAARAPGLVFAQRFTQNPAACYATVIDVLCIVFHSIAFRGAGSWYEQFLAGSSSPSLEQRLMIAPQSPPESFKAANDEDDEDEYDEEASTVVLAHDDDDDPEYENLSSGSTASTRTANHLRRRSHKARAGSTVAPIAAAVTIQDEDVDADTYTRQWIAALGPGYRETMG